MEDGDFDLDLYLSTHQHHIYYCLSSHGDMASFTKNVPDYRYTSSTDGHYAGPSEKVGRRMAL